MLLTSPKISVVPITQHVSLKNAIKQITKNRIIWTTIKVNKFLIDNFSLSKPKIAITGLNPHAGEKGNFGNEEDKYIKPAIKKLKSSGINITGPYPADTIFNKEIAKSFDVIICMYHDQATIPIKTIDFSNNNNYSSNQNSNYINTINLTKISDSDYYYGVTIDKNNRFL